jgi:hypothetical protein
MAMQLTPMEPMIPNADGSPFNPFHQDHGAMGTRLSEELYFMHYNFPDETIRWAYLVNVKTGERNRLSL